MAALGQTFDANNVAPAAPRDVVPPGDYLVQIIRSEMKPTAKGGEYLELELDILEGEYVNRKLWDRLNLVNSNTQASEIAQRTLSAICHATGQMTVSDSDQLHFKPVVATVKVRPAGLDKGGVMRDAQNEVRGYKAPGVGARTVAMPARITAAPASAAKSASTVAPPWRRAG